MFLDDVLGHQARATPNAVAVSMLGETTSYATLDSRADEISAHLLLRGVGPKDRVVICSTKGPDAIAAIFAILRIGATYVPVDPAAPTERILALMSTVSPAYVLTDIARLKEFADIFQGGVSDLSQPFLPLSDGNRCELNREKRSIEDPAYILMTSGTTGTPKGIVHTHESGMAYVKMAAQLCKLSPRDRVSHHTPLHFDMSIFDIFSTLSVGACVAVIPEMHTKLPASLSQLTQQERITVWYSVPYALIQMVERGALNNRDLTALRIVMFAGEKMPPASLKAFADHAPQATYINAYGPTETNHCTSAVFAAENLDGVSPLPIGEPVCETIIHLLSEGEDDTTGELLVASPQLMTGYWGNPDQTAKAFCHLPDENGTSRRFYRTGDIVRRNENGQLELVGRNDRQVKIRGYRVELDEIELALVNIPGISEACVFLHGDALLGFFSGRHMPENADVLAQLQKVLPTYAVPQSLCGLTDMPRTSTGKIDRKKLMGIADGQQAA